MLKVALLILVMIWSGGLSYRALFGIRDALSLGRLGRFDRETRQPRILRAAAEPLAFWRTVITWLVALIALTCLFLWTGSSLLRMMFGD